MSSLLAIICFILIGPFPPPSLLYSLRMRGPGFHVGTRLRREFVGGGGGATSRPGPRLRREYDGEGGRVGAPARPVSQ